MKQQSFTKNQIKELLKNKNVLKFRGTYITYNPEFKIKAVDQYLNKRMSPKEIFKQAGFNLNTIGEVKPKYLLHDWRIVFKDKGINGFKIEMRGRGGGRRKKIKENLTDEEKIKRLKLEVLYLKKEDIFLAKLRAKRAE
ncbi:MAG: hypothetical protein Q8M15_16910 [Bacteroidota bacterium]|nr:hypothetical protein [Bacteroidota bacterium]